MKIFILAGGFGTRLKSVVKELPKPMAPITKDKAFLDFQIEFIRDYFPQAEIYLLTYYLSEVIEKHYKNDSKIHIIKEKIPLGTGGSIVNAIKHLNLPIETKLLVLNGDTYIKPNLYDLIHNNNIISDIAIVASFQENCERFGSLNIKNGRIIEFKEKDKNCKKSYINAGCYFFNNLSIFQDSLRDNINFAIEELIDDKLKDFNIYAYLYNDIFIDIGIPEDYHKMIKHIGG